jgi:hypothetical protein
MAKKLTSFNAKDLEEVVSNALRKKTESIVTASITNISYVDEKKITLEKVIIEDTKVQAPKFNSFTLLYSFFFGIGVGIIATLSLVEKI